MSTFVLQFDHTCSPPHDYTGPCDKVSSFRAFLTVGREAVSRKRGKHVRATWRTPPSVWCGAAMNHSPSRFDRPGYNFPASGAPGFRLAFTLRANHAGPAADTVGERAAVFPTRCVFSERIAGTYAAVMFNRKRGAAIGWSLAVFHMPVGRRTSVIGSELAASYCNRVLLATVLGRRMQI